MRDSPPTSSVWCQRGRSSFVVLATEYARHSIPKALGWFQNLQRASHCSVVVVVVVRRWVASSTMWESSDICSHAAPRRRHPVRLLHVEVRSPYAFWVSLIELGVGEWLMSFWDEKEGSWVWCLDWECVCVCVSSRASCVCLSELSDSSENCELDFFHVVGWVFLVLFSWSGLALCWCIELRGFGCFDDRFVPASKDSGVRLSLMEGGGGYARRSGFLSLVVHCGFSHIWRGSVCSTKLRALEMLIAPVCSCSSVTLWKRVVVLVSSFKSMCQSFSSLRQCWQPPQPRLARCLIWIPRFTPEFVSCAQLFLEACISSFGVEGLLSFC